MSLTVQSGQRDDVVVIVVAGELDMATAPRLQAHITEQLERGHNRLVFDLSEKSPLRLHRALGLRPGGERRRRDPAAPCGWPRRNAGCAGSSR